MCCLFGRGFESLQLHIINYNHLFYRWLLFFYRSKVPHYPHLNKVVQKETYSNLNLPVSTLKERAKHQFWFFKPCFAILPDYQEVDI